MVEQINKWSYGKITKVPVKDYLLNPKTVVHSGQSAVVADYEMFKMIVSDWMKTYGLTKKTALDMYFDATMLQ
jgi:hypothetical protein